MSLVSRRRAVMHSIPLALCLPMILFVVSCNDGSKPVAETSSVRAAGTATETVNRTDPFAGDPMAAQTGRRLFVWYNCYGCHGGHGGGGMGPSLRDKVWLYGGSDDEIFDSIAEGRSKGMPAWGTKIPEQQIWQLVTYIKTMRTLAEPDPPNEPANEQTPNPEDNDRIRVGTQPAR